MIAIIDYGAGNLTSVQLAFDAIGSAACVTSEPDVINAAERVVFPGVGSAGRAMENLHALGLVPVLKKIVDEGKPFLGICLGTQIIFRHLEEDGGVEGLGFISGSVKRFKPETSRDKVPHIGWNTVSLVREHPLFAGIEPESEFYFVHSFYPEPVSSDTVIGRTGYAGALFASAVGQGSIFATQFHPEKSGRIGLKLLQNFSEWRPEC